ncbi:Serine/threonine protein kinase [Stigmatella aurantiaca]|uniref:Serine/threonine protein kinase n=1 Tax=Stigmatella aurantiaca TaxID=41 RepID=A0A1H7LV64_STIAU|nr:protein kinase [Stigmatella aurantiaca]SEL02395.1 Serine/threonine protein kinase [Stigmatella aurantiaca]
MSGRQIGNRYLLERRIADGGMGTIWVAHDAQLQRRVALKLMALGLPASAQARSQFEQEARTIAQLQNPHVVQVHDYGVDGDTPYIVMELLEGEDLETRLARQGRLPTAAVATLVQQVARALAAAHAAGIVHQDLKPANLFLARVDAEEVVKVLDFGLARLGAEAQAAARPAGKVMGTPRYMSPEQLRGEPHVDHRSDVWSLAVVAYRALTGHFPFSGDVLGEVRRGALVQAVPPSQALPGLGKELDALFAQALEETPARRFQSALEFSSAFASRVETRRRAAKVLVIDDEPSTEVMMRQRFRKLIREAQYEFLFASDGLDGLAKLRQHPDTDVVLSDINMPNMDGITFLSQVSEVNPLVKVIIVSAYSDMDKIRQVIHRGAFDFLVKPIDFADLEATIAKALRSATELRELVRSTEENQLLRLFVHKSLLERVAPLLPGHGMVLSERDEATVAFMDVPGFVTQARQEHPERALGRLNAVLDVVVPELTGRGGVVDRFIGDAVMVVFRGPQHLSRALEACLAARRQLREMTFRHGEQSAYAQGIRIGLDSGEVLCGSVGTRKLGRLDYAVIGEAVSVAARLALVAAKEQLLITETLRQRLGGTIESVRLEGRTLPGASAELLHDVVGRQEEHPARAADTATVEVKTPKESQESGTLAVHVAKSG